MLRRSLLTAAALATGPFGLGAHSRACTDDGEHCQALGSPALTQFSILFDPQFTGGAMVADDFSPARDGIIHGIAWHGFRILHQPQIPEDSFTIRYYADDGGLPGRVIGGPFSQSSGTLVNVGARETGEDVFGYPVFAYMASHPGVEVVGGQCYWIETSNAVVPAAPWFWSFARTNSSPPLYEGNGRMIADGGPPDGYDEDDLIGGLDLSFCVCVELATPACGLETLFNSGAEEPVLYDPYTTGDHLSTFIGFSSGRLCRPDCDTDQHPQRRSAQPFILPSFDQGDVHPGWRIRQIFVDGFGVDGTLNERLHFEIFARRGLERPTPADSIARGDVPFGVAEVPASHPQGGLSSGLHSINVDLQLAPGDYWLTVWASNTTRDPQLPSNFGWMSNAPDGIGNSCPQDNCIGPVPADVAAPEIIGCDPSACERTAGDPMMWRASNWPPETDGFGFGSYNLSPDSLTVDPENDPTPDPADLYNAAFMIRGERAGGSCGDGVLDPGEQCDDGNSDAGDGCSSACRIEAVACPWDCTGDDRSVDVCDLLLLLAQWGGQGCCDTDGLGVELTDLEALLLNWGPCPELPRVNQQDPAGR